MPLEYSITYKAENTYENWVDQAHWQFLIIPQQNSSQEFIGVAFTNSINAENEYSINGYGFQTIRVRPKKKFKTISFQADIRLIKREINPFDFHPDTNVSEAYENIEKVNFRVDFEPFLRKTNFTTVPEKKSNIFRFDRSIPLFDNLQALNDWVYRYITFKTDVTAVNTELAEVIEKQQGVCQDFTHLFCALSRLNGTPARYVSGYLHQGNGYFGDSQMHAWAEVYVPNLGWVGFDPTNNLMANTNHIKVAHGKDYNDCSPLRGVVYTSGENKTIHSVKVMGQQQQ
mgnify:CR=1 FL=1